MIQVGPDEREAARPLVDASVKFLAEDAIGSLLTGSGNSCRSA
jgi:hypothetical protein